MNMQGIDTLRALLPDGRTLYYYGKDKYSFQLLRYAMPGRTTVNALRRQPVAPLLQKPALKPLLSDCGGILDHDALHMAESALTHEAFTLTLDVWGQNNRSCTRQTSRNGANLVLQLNFGNRHNQAFCELLQPFTGNDPFNYQHHPVHKDDREKRRYTMAWARLDMDFEHDEALIEEIQTDWLRCATACYQWAHNAPDERFSTRYGHFFSGTRSQMLAYYEKVLAPFYKWWDEAMLSAVLFFLREELGLRNIWMHTPQSGVLFKKIHYSAPPTSLYSDLPRRFCFRQEESLPEFLVRERHIRACLRKVPTVRLHKFAL